MKKHAVMTYLNQRAHELTLARHEIEKELMKINYMLDFLAKATLVEEYDKCTEDASENTDSPFPDTMNKNKNV